MQRAHSFFSPLKGKTVTFLVDDRRTNLLLARTITLLSSAAGRRLAVFDIDAFYSTNSTEILSALPKDAAQSIHIYVPKLGWSIETEVARLFSTESDVLLLESLNTIYHLFSSSGVSSRSRKLAFSMASLSYLARIGTKPVLLIMYRRERVVRTERGGSISNLSDATVAVEINTSGLLMKCKRGNAWPEERFSLRFP